MKNIFREKILNILLFFLIIIIPLQTRYFFYTSKIENIFFEYGTIAIYLTDIYILFFIIYLLIYNFKNKLFKFNNRIKTFFILLTIFNISLNISLIQSINKNISLYFNIRFFILSIFVFLLSFTKINKNIFKDGFIYSSFFEACIAIYQFADQKIIANKFLGLSNHFPYDLGTSVIENINGRLLRSYGLLTHPNILGIFLLIGFIFLFIKMLNQDNKKYLNYFLLGVIFIGIILTFSRTVFLMLLIFFIIFFVYKIKNKDFKKNDIYKLSIIFFIIFSNLFIFKNLIFTRISDNRLNNISNSERSNQYLESINVIKDNFFFGVGERNYTLYILDKNQSNDPYIKPVHNIYLLALCELGLFGFIIFILLTMLPLYIKQSLDIKIIYFLILVSGLFDHFLLTENFGLFIIIFFLGMMFINTNKDV